MTDGLSLFEDPTPDEHTVHSLTASQRQLIRERFTNLGITTAREQFALVKDLIGVRISRVVDLTESDAQSLLYALQGRAQHAGRTRTGDSWTDREDTWIDKL
ncbi:hypothetical protein [Mycetocola sp. 2940]|uniref:hypothetical protein n=1 Tax=Mycetocola sp. 2940 TaxID=3156452 RepID=UPI0033945678